MQKIKADETAESNYDLYKVMSVNSDIAYKHCFTYKNSKNYVKKRTCCLAGIIGTYPIFQREFNQKD